MKVFRTERERDKRFAEAKRWHREFGLNFRTLNGKQIQETEPHLAPVLCGALHWVDPLAVIDPQGLALSYLALFEKLGGRFVQAERFQVLGRIGRDAHRPQPRSDVPLKCTGRAHRSRGGVCAEERGMRQRCGEGARLGGEVRRRFS